MKPKNISSPRTIKPTSAIYQHMKKRKYKIDFDTTTRITNFENFRYRTRREQIEIVERKTTNNSDGILHLLTTRKTNLQ